ncbi:MAG: SapC family protein [Parasphingopyxis sp.]|nr:SapC family protein [Sphingomonadales bacterium]
MASAAPAPRLPMLYDDLRPLSSLEHGDYRLQARNAAPFITGVHALPVTVDEFVLLQRSMPIVFSVGEKPVPLALMGLNEGVNVFIDDEGQLVQPGTYLPAYVRRYPFMLAKLQQDSQEMSLCFDPTSDAVGDFDEGERLFDGGQPTETTNQILKFCEQFETAAIRSQAFVDKLVEYDLLMDGEMTIQPEGSDKPFRYRGFKMVNEEKLKELDAEKHSEMAKNGMIALIYAHLFSMSLVRDVFARQMQQGKMPQPDAQIPEAAEKGGAPADA